MSFIFDDLLRSMFGGEKLQKLAAPVITCENDVVTMTGSGTIRYTTDLTTPNENSTVYTSPITILQDTTFKAYCSAPGMADSDVTTYLAVCSPDMEETYFYVEDASGQQNQFYIDGYANAPSVTVYYSTDKTRWYELGTTGETRIYTFIPANGKIFLRATANTWGSYSNQNYANHINCQYDYNVGGNVMSLIYGSNFIGQTELKAAYSFAQLFYNTTVTPNTKLKDISKLRLPATTLKNGCYEEMFYNCTAITSIPDNFLPSMVAMHYCYHFMFGNCTGLVNVQSNLLPATTIVSGCYYGMFQGCTSLKNAPSLPATDLDVYCYQQMFKGCTSLTQAPVLPAPTLVNKDFCYNSMFEGCSSLKNLTCLATTGISGGNYATTNWLKTVGSNGTFTKAANATDWNRGASGIPTSWTIVDAS